MEQNDAVTLFVSNLNAVIDRDKLNPHEIAARVGNNPTLVYDIIKGKSRSPKLDTVDKIAKAVGIPLVALLLEPGTDDLDREITEALGALPAADRRRFLSMARSWRDGPEST